MEIEKLIQIESLKEIKKLLDSYDRDEIRESLYAYFVKYSNYKNATEWNKAVRLCECLTIVGWGGYEPVQASRGKFFNGNPETLFYNRFSELRFVDAIWSKRKDGVSMEQGRTSYHESPALSSKPTILWDYPVIEEIQDIKLATQRNWIPQNPILITRGIENCYENSKALIDDFRKNLVSALDLKMQPEQYGKAISKIRVICYFSYPESNHIITKDHLNLKSNELYTELLKTHSKTEISANGYFLRNRYELSSFRSKTGLIEVGIHFEKELSELPYIGQKNKFSEHLVEALKMVIEKLKKKKIDYNLDLMFNDFCQILNEWIKIPPQTMHI